MFKSVSFCFLLIALSIGSAFNRLLSQERPVLYTLEVRVVESFYPKKRPIQYIRVDLTTNKNEVICSGITDSLGAVFFDHNCVKSDFDTIIIKFYRGNEHLSWDDREFVNPFIQRSDKRSFDFIKEIQLIRPCFGFPGLIHVQCQIHDAEIFLDFDAENLKSVLQEYPSLCIQISQTKHPDETIELASERMKNFELYLKNSGVDMTRITFSYNFYTISTELLDKFPQPKIEFVIHGYDCG
jgi:hypothetical protein